MPHAQVVTLKVGFSHDVRYTLPDALRAFLPEPTLIGLYGIDKNQVCICACNHSMRCAFGSLLIKTRL
jgi:ribosomal protein L6P/L9E